MMDILVSTQMFYRTKVEVNLKNENENKKVFWSPKYIYIYISIVILYNVCNFYIFSLYLLTT